jgi:arabinogalactan oligomer/maltooligosaccharide transport system substrate-binding protein
MSMKRILAHLLPLTLLCAMLLAACGSGGSSGSSQAGGSSSGSINYSGTITIWHNWQGDYLNAKKAIFDAYTKLHPKVTINLVHQDDVIAKSITAIRANNGPDIIDYTDDNLGKLAASGSVIPMDQYISPDFVNSTYSKPAAEAVTFNGHIYGVPETVEAITMMYNKKLVNASDLPKTSDDMLTFEKNYEQQHPGQYGIVWDINNGYDAAAFFYGYGATYVTPDGKAHLDTPEALAATQFLGSFRPYMPRQINYDVASSLFTEGKAAVIINGPWSYADYAKANIDVGFATLPVIASNNTPAKPFVGVKSLWVSRNAKNVALCADLLKFFTNKENQVAMVAQTGEIPANLAAENDPSVQSNPAIGGYAAQAKLGVALPNTPYMSALWDPLAKALTAVWNGSQTPQAALAAAQDAATKGIAQITS